MKKEWRGITDRCKNGSGLIAEEEPLWYPHLNAVFLETNVSINLVSSAMETFFVGGDETSDKGDKPIEEAPAQAKVKSKKRIGDKIEDKKSSSPKLVASVHIKRT